MFHDFPRYTFRDFDGVSTVTAKAVNIAVSLGMLVVVSAGNLGVNGIATPADAERHKCPFS